MNDIRKFNHYLDLYRYITHLVIDRYSKTNKYPIIYFHDVSDENKVLSLRSDMLTSYLATVTGYTSEVDKELFDIDQQIAMFVANNNDIIVLYHKYTNNDGIIIDDEVINKYKEKYTPKYESDVSIKKFNDVDSFMKYISELVWFKYCNKPYPNVIFYNVMKTLDKNVSIPANKLTSQYHSSVKYADKEMLRVTGEIAESYADIIVINKSKESPIIVLYGYNDENSHNVVIDDTMISRYIDLI